MGKHAISVQGLVKTFGAVKALDEVSLEIAPGELFFLLGGSGCGKTTLLRCLAGLERPDSGKVHFGDQDVTQVPTHKREAALVFQSYALWPHMTVAQNIAFGLEERKVPRAEITKRVEEALAMVQLEGYGERGVDQMSGGQQQRVSLARALVVRPRCLLLDEPLSNLDAQLRLEMRAEIRRIVKENGLTGVYVTHDQAEALSMADRMAVMDEGQVSQVGTPQEIYRSPLSAQVASFIGETNLLSGKVSASEGELVIETEAGVFAGTPSPSDWSPQEGERVQVSIRPEAMRVKEDGMPGTVEEATYLGSTIQYRVKMGAGEIVSLSEMNPRVVRKAGDTLRVKVAKEDVVILKEGS